MSIAENLNRLKKEIPSHVKLVAVSKTYPVETVLEAYQAGQRIFGENRVQELAPKHQDLPNDVEWHLIGHLQTNKVKFIAPFVRLIHSVDSLKLLQEINKCAERYHRIIECLLQIHIAQEETKFGLNFAEAEEIFSSKELSEMKHVHVTGLMGMATLTENENQVRKEFKTLKSFFDNHCQLPSANCQLEILSMGMSSDYKIAIEEGSTMIRVGSLIFGERH
jgi:hypothetical protein